MLKIFQRKKKNECKDELASHLGDFELPSFSASTIKILELIRDPDSDLDDVSEAMQTSPAIMIKVLQLVNSAAFGSQHSISNINHAACMLGRARLESTVLGVVVKENLPQPKGGRFDTNRFWRSALRRAVLAKRLAEILHPAVSTEAFTMGLLQDMGVQVLAASRTSEYDPILEEWLEDETLSNSLESVEQEMLGTTHAEVGQLLGNFWEMPDDMLKAIGDHHGTDDVLPALQLVSLLREGEHEQEIEMILERAEADFGIDRDQMKLMIAEAFEEAAELETMMR